MLSEHDIDYYRRRLVEEMERAQLAETDVARVAHRQLADLYKALLLAPLHPRRGAARKTS